MHAWFVAAWLVALGPSPTPGASATRAVTTDDPMLAAYYAELARRGLVDRREPTLQDVQALLRAGQAQYVRGDALGSAVTLFDLCHDPRYDNFAELPEMISAWYHLGVALQAYGAELTARAAYAEVLARGPDEPYFTPALRRVVDLALLGKDYARGLDEVRASLRGPDGRPWSLPALDQDELDYLQARADQRGGRLDEALRGYAAVSPRSRFHTAGLYLQGTIHAERKQYRDAEAKFCEVVQGPNASTTAFYVDRRYFPVRDLANLGLGRVAHEERRHPHAFYHYFQVPEDSPELPKALFEAAWTMAEHGEYAVARDLVSDLRSRYPDTPQAVEAELLDALLKLYDCDFRTAETEFTRFIERMAPVTDHIESIRQDPAKIRALHRELGALRKGGGQAADSDAHRLLLAMLDEEPTYGRLSHRADVLRREAALAEAMHARADQLQVALGDRKTSVEGTPGARALDALASADDLERGVAGLERQIRVAEAAGAEPNEIASARQELDRLRGEVERLRTSAARGLLEAPPVGVAQTGGLIGALERDKAMLERLRGQALALAVGLDDQAAGAAATQLGRLQQRIDDMMGEARMGRIDAVLGAKKKLEIEVQDMAAGRFPPELFGKLQIEGLIGDDEEFWPYEGEYWADEYEGYE